jgi:hypothetical protein
MSTFDMIPSEYHQERCMWKFRIVAFKVMELIFDPGEAIDLHRMVFPNEWRSSDPLGMFLPGPGTLLAGVGFLTIWPTSEIALSHARAVQLLQCPTSRCNHK